MGSIVVQGYGSSDCSPSLAPTISSSALDDYAVEVGDNVTASVVTTNTTTASHVSVLFRSGTTEYYEKELTSVDGLTWTGIIDTRNIGVYTVTQTVRITTSVGGVEGDMGTQLVISASSLDDPRDTVVALITAYYGTDADGDTLASGVTLQNGPKYWFDKNKAKFKQIVVVNENEIMKDYMYMGLESNQQYNFTQLIFVIVCAPTKEERWSMVRQLQVNLFNDEVKMKNPGGGLDKIICFHETAYDYDCWEDGCKYWHQAFLLDILYDES